MVGKIGKKRIDRVWPNGLKLWREIETFDSLFLLKLQDKKASFLQNKQYKIALLQKQQQASLRKNGKKPLYFQSSKAYTKSITEVIKRRAFQKPDDVAIPSRKLSTTSVKNSLF